MNVPEKRFGKKKKKFHCKPSETSVEMPHFEHSGVLWDREKVKA